MFGSLGGPEVLVIFIVALIVFGPKRLPEIGRKVGGVVREIKRATGEFRSNVEREIGFDPISGVEVTRRARRELLSTVSEPIREAAQGTIDLVREVREEASNTLRVAGIRADEPEAPSKGASKGASEGASEGARKE